MSTPNIIHTTYISYLNWNLFGTSILDQDFRITDRHIHTSNHTNLTLNNFHTTNIESWTCKFVNAFIVNDHANQSVIT